MNRHLRNTVATIATCMALALPPIAAKKKGKDPGANPSNASAGQAATPAAGAPAQAAAPTVESSAPPSKTLERALKLYNSED